MSHGIKPNIFGIMVNKNNIIFKSINSKIMRWAPNIRVNQFKWSSAGKTMSTK
jgi:hypothetical protein